MKLKFRIALYINSNTFLPGIVYLAIFVGIIMYKIVEVLNISKSLSSQIEKDTEDSSDIHKVVLTNEEETAIVYFMDGICAGPESTLKITNKNTYPLI